MVSYLGWNSGVCAKHAPLGAHVNGSHNKSLVTVRRFSKDYQWKRIQSFDIKRNKNSTYPIPAT